MPFFPGSLARFLFLKLYKSPIFATTPCKSTCLSNAPSLDTFVLNNLCLVPDKCHTGGSLPRLFLKKKKVRLQGPREP